MQKPNNWVDGILARAIVVQVFGKYVGCSQKYGPLLVTDYTVAPNV